MSLVQKFNIYAIKAQKGDKESEARLLSLCTPIIEKVSNSIWPYIKNETYFERDCFRQITDAIKKFNPVKGNFYFLVLKMVYRIRNDHLKRRSINRELLTSLDAPIAVNDEETISLYDILPDRDALACVEQEVLLKEKVALLAEGDPRRLAVLKAWMAGCNNFSEISRMLAHTFGGKPESHRKFIQRFKTECKTTLADVV